MQMIVCLFPLYRKKKEKRPIRLKWIAVLFIAMCCSFKGVSQTITLSETNASLEKIFHEIKRQTGYTFLATKEQLKKGKPVTIHVSNSSLENALQLCFKDQPLSYKIINTTIAVADKEVSSKAVVMHVSQDTAGLFVQGRVSNEKGEPLASATILEKGTSNATETSGDGTFYLKLKKKANVVLAISYVGYNTSELTINESSVNLSVSLVPAQSTNDTIVVVGYGRQRKQSVVGAITQVKGDVLERTGGVSSLGATLTGNLPGVVTVATQGTPGAEDPKIYIRGQSTWNNSDPLILVDGIERPMNSVDIGSVETISVLKDASATAVFGVKGANGVILITTKRGREGKADIRFTVNTTMKVPSKLASKFDSYDALRIRDLAIENELGVSPGSWNSYVPYSELEKYRHPASQAEAERYPNIDWQDQVVKKFAFSQNASVNISGGSPFVKYFSSIDYLHEGDIIKKIENNKSYKPGYGFDRINARTNLDFNLTKTTVLTANLAGSYGVRQDAWGQDSWEYRIWQSIYSNAPNIYYPRYSDGGWGYFPAEQVSTINSLATMGNNGIRKTTTTRITTDFTLRQDLSALLKGLAVKGLISFDNSFVSQGGIYDNGTIQQEYINPVTGDTTYSQYLGTNQFNWIPFRWTPNSDAVQNASTYRKLFYQLQVDYSGKVGKHEFTAMGLFSRDRYATGSEFEHYREDWVSRVTYNYALKYFAEFNGAYNGSEKFGPNYRFAFFPSVAAGWVISNEKFLKNLSFISNIKLRGSYGKVGNDNIASRWLYLTTWTYGGNTPLGASSGQNSPYTWWSEAHTSVGNPDIHWETVTKADIGMDFTLWSGLLSGSADIFSDYRTDILLDGSSRAVPSYFGVQPATANLGKVRNKGYEVELRVNKTLSRNLRVWANFNMTFAKDKIIEADDAGLLDDYLKKAGKQIGQAYSYVSSGYYNTWDQVYGSTQLNTYDNQKLPGNLNMIDYNGDGVVDNKDIVPAGYPERPQKTYNATLGVEWKGFSAFVQFYAVSNANRYLQLVSFGGQYHYDNVYKQGDYWSPANPNANVPIPRYASVMPYYGTTYLYDGSYIRLKNAEIAYTFKAAQLKKAGINALRIYVNGDNLILWTKMPDDREVSMGAATAYPTIRRFNLGCNLTF